MLNEAKELQQNAVAKLVKQALSPIKNIVFKAPTGCGKTYMMADMIDQLLVHPERLKGYDTSVKDIVFLVSSLSKSDLTKQNYEKFCEYSNKKFFANLNPYLINSEIVGEERLFIPTDYNVYFLPRDLYKKNSRLMRGAMESFLQNLTAPTTLEGKGKRIILVKDECQIATNNLDGLNSYFDKIINFSATPRLGRGQQPTVEITEEDAVAAKIIKSVNWQSDDETLSDAINKYIEIKEKYQKLFGFKPCLIIQISNQDRADEEIEQIQREINNRTELQWMLIVGEDRNCDTNNIIRKYPVSLWKDKVKENISTIDIIIFKMVITEGWDIPRACMLYQIRDVNSSQLNEQVIGRIRRNPKLLDYETLTPEQQELALQSWVWGVHNNEAETRQWKSVKLQEEEFASDIKIKTTKLKSLDENNKNFDINSFIKKQDAIIAPNNIFDLGRKIRKLDSEIQEKIYGYATDYQKWWEIAEHTNALKKEYDTYICNYEESMEITQENGKDKEVSFPITSQYLDTSHILEIEDSVWMIKGNTNDSDFSFDSAAERKWARELQKIAMRGLVAEPSKNGLFSGDKEIYLWGKNYIPNSDIKYEYYLNGIHSSYPDFIMKDRKGNIHIFEVKSVNISKEHIIDTDEYNKKIEELKKSYKQASKLTQHIFYLPLLKDNDWRITRYQGGVEDMINEKMFEESLK